MTKKNSRAFGAAVARLIIKEHLSREETREFFCQILADEQTDMHQGAFLAALKAKGETIDEIAGSWEAIYELDTVKVKPEVSVPLVENCGTGMDAVKTFNISTAASLVAAAMLRWPSMSGPLPRFVYSGYGRRTRGGRGM